MWAYALMQRAFRYPLDTIKVRLQSSPHGYYRGALHCARSIIRNEGVRSLYRGVSSPLVGGAIEAGFTYALYSRVLGSLSAHKDADAMGTRWGSPSLLHVPVASAVSGLVMSLMVSPVELVTIRMQMAGSHYHSPLHCLKSLLQSEGPRGLTRGLGATIAREVPGSMVYFTVYEGLKQVLREYLPSVGVEAAAKASARVGSTASVQGSSGHAAPGPAALGPTQGAPTVTPSPKPLPEGSCNPGQPAGLPDRRSSQAALAVSREAAIAILSGGSAGCAMWAVILPLDVAKTRVQTSAPGTKWDVSIRQHLRLLWSEGGLKALYAGLTPTLVRAFPSNGAQFAAWELAMYMLSDHRD